MEQLSIVDTCEWWITWEDGYGDHDIAARLSDELTAKHVLADYRAGASRDRKVRYECQKILVHRTAEKLDW